MGEGEVKRLRISINGTGLDFDRDYGIDRRTGWTAVVGGSVQSPQLTSLPRALWALVKRLWEGEK